MPNYTLPRSLYEQAVQEYSKQWGSDARSVFERTWQMVIQAHHGNKPQQTPLHLPPIKGMEGLRQKMLANHDATFKIIQSNHRLGLIKLFTMERGLTQATAEKIVDEHILIH